MPRPEGITAAQLALSRELTEQLTMYGLSRLSFGAMDYQKTDKHPEGAITLQLTFHSESYLAPRKELPEKVNGIPVEYHLVAAITKDIVE